MINKEKLASLQTMVRGGESPMKTMADMSDEDLRALRDAINAMLPEDTMSGIDLEGELVTQHRDLKALYRSIVNDPEVQANQKAQVANSILATLGSMKKMQDDLMRDRTSQAIEKVLIAAIQTLPQETKDAFYEEMELLAKKEGLV